MSAALAIICLPACSGDASARRQSRSSGRATAIVLHACFDRPASLILEETDEAITDGVFLRWEEVQERLSVAYVTLVEDSYSGNHPGTQVPVRFLDLEGAGAVLDRFPAMLKYNRALRELAANVPVQEIASSADPDETALSAAISTAGEVERLVSLAEAAYPGIDEQEVLAEVCHHVVRTWRPAEAEPQTVRMGVAAYSIDIARKELRLGLRTEADVRRRTTEILTAFGLTRSDLLGLAGPLGW